MFMVILSHLLIPHTKILHQKVHSDLITLFLAQAADIYDFSEYQNQDIIDNYAEMNILYGYLSLEQSFKKIFKF